MTKRTIRIIITLFTLLSGVAAAGIGTATPAGAALCTQSPLDGDWRNTDSATRSMTEVVVATCAPVSRCSGDICTSTYGTVMNPYGKCHPQDCNWGRQEAEHLADGWIRSIYNFGFKSSHVWLKNYEYFGRTYLRVWVYNDFTSADGRADYTTDEWFLK